MSCALVITNALSSINNNHAVNELIEINTSEIFFDVLEWKLIFNKEYVNLTFK